MKKYLYWTVVVFLVCLARMIPFHWIVGSYNAHFSWSTMIAPIIAKYAGLSWVGLFVVTARCTSWQMLFLSCIKRIPLMISSRAYIQPSRMLYQCVPMLCMILFMVHPVGQKAWVYSLYWLIPFALWWVVDSMYIRALAASFIAHAIGSVIWLYMGHIPAEIWLQLIPVVWIERLTMAGCIVTCDYAVMGIKVAFKTLKQRTLALGLV